jgi:hypothetical protein
MLKHFVIINAQPNTAEEHIGKSQEDYNGKDDPQNFGDVALSVRHILTAFLLILYNFCGRISRRDRYNVI